MIICLLPPSFHPPMASRLKQIHLETLMICLWLPACMVVFVKGLKQAAKCSFNILPTLGCKGGCQLHSSSLGPNLECAAGSLSLCGQDGACATLEQPETFNYCIPDQLDAQEQKDIASALAHSLEPVSHAFYLYLMNSYDSALGLMHSNSSSNLTSSMGPTQSLDTGSSIPVSVTEMLSALAFSSNMHLCHFTPISSTSHTQLPFKPAATTTPPVAPETSRDCAAKWAQDIQSTSNKLPVASIDAQLLQQMHRV